MTSAIKLTCAAVCVLLTSTLPALAHGGAGDHGGLVHGLVHGFLHPVSGLDHLVAIALVGLLAAHMGGRMLWALPAVFAGAMLAGFWFGTAGTMLPYTEVMIAASVAVFGLLFLSGGAHARPVSVGLVGFFAVFHGHAHGFEMPSGVSTVAYCGGFALATIGLLGAGVLAQLGMRRVSVNRAIPSP